MKNITKITLFLTLVIGLGVNQMAQAMSFWQSMSTIAHNTLNCLKENKEAVLVAGAGFLTLAALGQAVSPKKPADASENNVSQEPMGQEQNSTAQTNVIKDRVEQIPLHQDKPYVDRLFAEKLIKLNDPNLRLKQILHFRDERNKFEERKKTGAAKMTAPSINLGQRDLSASDGFFKIEIDPTAELLEKIEAFSIDTTSYIEHLFNGTLSDSITQKLFDNFNALEKEIGDALKKDRINKKLIEASLFKVKTELFRAMQIIDAKINANGDTSKFCQNLENTIFKPLASRTFNAMPDAYQKLLDSDDPLLDDNAIFAEYRKSINTCKSELEKIEFFSSIPQDILQKRTLNLNKFYENKDQTKWQMYRQIDYCLTVSKTSRKAYNALLKYRMGNGCYILSGTSETDLKTNLNNTQILHDSVMDLKGLVS